MRNGVGRGEKRSVQPSSSLIDELWETLRYVRFGNRALDIAKNPGCDMIRTQQEKNGNAALLYQLELALAINSKHSIRYKGGLKCAVNNLTVTYILREICASQSVVSSSVTGSSDVHMFEVKMSVSRPCRISPLKYDANGPCPVLSFCNAWYLYAEKAPG